MDGRFAPFHVQGREICEVKSKVSVIEKYRTHWSEINFLHSVTFKPNSNVTSKNLVLLDQIIKICPTLAYRFSP